MTDKKTSSAAALLGAKGGKAGKGEKKRRDGEDPDYYKRIAAKRWAKKPAPDKPAP